MHIPMCTIQHPTGSGARLISLWANGDAAILWNDTEYRYRGVNAFDALAIFTANRSMGRLANFIKHNSELVVA
jgi:hypothetical protein